MISINAEQTFDKIQHSLMTKKKKNLSANQDKEYIKKIYS